MLRLPATSIDLSEQDVSFHLHQIDIYHGLLKQGFKKADVIRYIRDHNKAKETRAAETHIFLAPSTVDLALSNTGSQVTHVSPPPSGDAKSALTPNESGVAEDSTPSPVDLLWKPAERNTSHDLGHAPRKSSMLRFSEVASSSASEEAESPVHFPRTPRSAITYRPRTDTYSYNESDVFDSDVLDTKTSEAGDGIDSPGRSELRADAEAFVPGRAPRSEGTAFTIYEDDTAEDMFLITPENPEGSSSLQPLFTTPPRQARITTRVVQSASRSRQLDGHFSVYNDAAPSLTQPETPADLERNSRASTAYSMAFTAPPGRVRSPGSQRHRTMVYEDAGSQTPTARAIFMRERRARELRRGIQVETARLDRLRLSDTSEDRENAGPADASDTDVAVDWRNDLEADRVGDENWEIAPMTHDGFEQLGRIRTLSGNARIPS